MRKKAKRPVGGSGDWAWLLTIGLLIVAACKRPTSSIQDLGTKADAQVDGKSAVSQSRAISPIASPRGPGFGDALTEIPQKPIPYAGLLLEPGGQRAGTIPYDQPEICDIWSLKWQAYLGSVPKKLCQGWHPANYTNANEDKERSPWDKQPPQVVDAPDGTLRARGARDHIELLDAKTSALLYSLPLAPNTRLVPGLLHFGPQGLIAFARKDSSFDVEGVEVLHFWPSPLSPKSASSVNTHVFPDHTSSPYGSEVMIDPAGRYVFVSQSIDRVGTWHTIFDVKSWHETPLSWAPLPNFISSYGDADSEFRKGRWQGGALPYWETVEAVTHPDDPATAKPYLIYWRLLTAPGDRRLMRFNPHPDGPLRVGKTKAMSGQPMTPAQVRERTSRFVGTRVDTLKRLSDGEEVTLQEDGCAYSRRGSYSCTAKELSHRAFLLGPDQLTAPVVSGLQLIPLAHDPELLTHFFDGAPLLPRPLAQGERPGLPPLLELHQVDVDKAAKKVQLRFTPLDQGDGVAAVYWEGPGSGLGHWLPAVAGQQASVTVPFSEDDCGDVLLFACNREKRVCSMPQQTRVCPKEDSASSGSSEGKHTRSRRF